MPQTTERRGLRYKRPTDIFRGGLISKIAEVELIKGLGLLDATMLIMGSMIGSGIFIVSADIAKAVQSPGLLLLIWVISGLMTIMGALSYGELSAAISELRKKHQTITGKVSSAELHSFCEQWNIPDSQRDLVLSKLDANAPKTLSLQIMQSKGMIEDPKAFLDFQPFVSRMNQNRDLRIKSRIAEMLLDFPTCHPDMMQPEKHWDTLEAVALKTL